MAIENNPFGHQYLMKIGTNQAALLFVTRLNTYFSVRIHLIKKIMRTFAPCKTD